MSAQPSPTVVITGAGGWLGQNLVRALAGQRERLRCLVREPADGPLLELVHPSVEIVVGDVRDPAVMDDLLSDAAGATVFHTVGVIHPERSTREFYDVNVGGTQLVLDSARRAGAGRFVHISSNSPFGANAQPTERFTEDSPTNPYLGYGRSKLEAEQLVEAAHGRGDLETVILRPPWFYGPFQPARQAQFFRSLRRGRFPLVGDGTQQRSMCFTGNLVQGCLRAEVAEGAPGGAYWIADAEPYELRRIFEGVREALVAEGFEVSKRPWLPFPRFLADGAVLADRALQSVDRYVQPAHVLGELRDTIACDITRARDDLGYDPEVSLVDGMRESIRWCTDRGIAL